MGGEETGDGIAMTRWEVTRWCPGPKGNDMPGIWIHAHVQPVRQEAVGSEPTDERFQDGCERHTRRAGVGLSTLLILRHPGGGPGRSDTRDLFQPGSQQVRRGQRVAAVLCQQDQTSRHVRHGRPG